MRPHINGLRSGSGFPPPRNGDECRNTSPRETAIASMKTEAGQGKRKLKMKKDIYCFT